MNGPDTKQQTWIYCPTWNMIFGTSPKAGCTSLFQAIGKYNHACWNPKETSWNMAQGAVWIVRDPVSRFIALWKDKCRDEEPLWVDGDYNPIKGMEPSELMTFIESTEIKDNHWAIQSKLCGRRATEIVPLEKFSKWWDDRGFPHMEMRNTTKGTLILSSELTERIEEHYKKDVRLYREAL